MIAVDTSVVVAGWSSWHAAHAAAHEVLAAHPAVPAHVLAETYAILTGFPPPHRLTPGVVEAALARQFPDGVLTLDARGYREVVGLVAREGLPGGAVYDAVIGATAAAAGAELVTLDERAAPTYRAVGVAVRLLS